MRRLYIVGYLAIIMLVGCGFALMGLGIAGPEALLSEDATNGEYVFKTGYNIDGQPIPFEGGPAWLYMHGGGCAACHGVDGVGGQLVMMSDQIPPNIQYSHLIEEEHEEGEEHPPYDDDLIARAIREGLNPAGEELNEVMPRWTLSDKDMTDLIDYLKTLSNESS